MSQKIKHTYWYGGVVVLFLLFPLYSQYKILTDFAHAPIPDSDIVQYISDWPAGGGVKEATAFFQNQAKSHKIFIGTEGTFGLMPYAFEIYLGSNPNVIIKGYWPIHDTPEQDLLAAAKTKPTYVVFYQPCPSCKAIGDAPVTWPVKQVMQIDKPGGTSKLTVYQLLPQ